jgi:hypothetical protein
MTPNESNESNLHAGPAARPARTRAATRIPMSIIAAAILAIAAPLAAGCATNAADDPPAGQLVFPLLQPGPDGALYHLANATFDIVQSGTGVTQTVDGSGNQSTVAVFLNPGVYSVTLRDGWVLERSDDAGATFQQVDALLGSLNPSGFRVLANQPVIVEFDFLIRETFGTLEIKLGVVPKPRGLAGGFIVATATDGLAAYADPANHLMDFAVFFKLGSLASVTLPDGTKQHIYTAGPSATPGPNPPTDTPVAAELYNDRVGALPSPLSSGGTSLQYTVAAKPDGTVELSGILQGDVEIDFGPSAIDAASAPTIGPDGFPNDEFFYDSGSPFTLTSSVGTLSGTLRVRHLIP